MLKKNISKHRVILLAIMMFTMSFAVNPIMFAKALVDEGVYTNPVPPGYTLIDFEGGVDYAPIGTDYPGLSFSLGPEPYYGWIYGDIRTHNWNVRSLTEPYNYGPWVINGLFFAFIYSSAARIDFTDGPVNYFSVLVTTSSGNEVYAYDSDDNLIAQSGWCASNLYTYTFTSLTVEAPGIAYVIIEDSGGYWGIDDLVFGRGIEATINFDPDTLNRKSMGKWVTVYITVDGYDVEDIDVDTILLNGVLSRAESSPTEIEDGILMVKFDREDVALLFEPGETVVITISGELGDETFEGVDETISFIN